MRRARVAALAGPKMPADRGLPSLGLLMQLGGTMFLAFWAVQALAPIIGGGGAPGSQTWWLFLLFSTAAVRSACHRAAGKALVFGAPGGPLGRPVARAAGIRAVARQPPQCRDRTRSVARRRVSF